MGKSGTATVLVDGTEVAKVRVMKTIPFRFSTEETLDTARQLNRATLARQLLLRREPLDVVEAVRRVVALQAQEPASPYVALWNRVEGFDPAELDAAFASQAIVKAQLMRITLHAVAAADYPAVPRGDAAHAARRAAPRPAVHGRGRLDRRHRGARPRPARVHGLATRRTARSRRGWKRASAPRSRASGGRSASTGRSSTPRPAAHGRSARGPPTSARRTRRARATPPASTRWLVAATSRGSGRRRCWTSRSSGRSFGRRSRTRSRRSATSSCATTGPTATTLYDVPDGLAPARGHARARRACCRCGTARCSPTPTGAGSSRPSTARSSSATTATCCRRCSSTATSRASGVRPTTASRPPRSTALDDDAWAGLEAEARRLRAFLAGREPIIYQGATPTGGPSCRPTASRSASSAAEAEPSHERMIGTDPGPIVFASWEPLSTASTRRSGLHHHGLPPPRTDSAISAPYAVRHDPS